MKDQQTPVKLDKFEGHVVLLCKGHYKHYDFFLALKQLWAVRCGIPEDYKSDRMLEYIASAMFEIIIKTKSQSPDRIMDIVHKGMCNSFAKPENMTPIQSIIWEYRRIILSIQTKEKIEGTQSKYVTLVEIPSPEKQVVNRILRGNGRYEDYKIIS